MNNSKEAAQKTQPSLFEQTDNWVGMPEFVQEKKEAYKTLVVRFDSEGDYLDFQRRLEQELTEKTKSIWHPFKSHYRDGVQPAWVTDE